MSATVNNIKPIEPVECPKDLYRSSRDKAHQAYITYLVADMIQNLPPIFKQWPEQVTIFLPRYIRVMIANHFGMDVCTNGIEGADKHGPQEFLGYKIVDGYENFFVASALRDAGLDEGYTYRIPLFKTR